MAVVVSDDAVADIGGVVSVAVGFVVVKTGATKGVTVVNDVSEDDCSSPAFSA